MIEVEIYSKHTNVLTLAPLKYKRLTFENNSLKSCGNDEGVEGGIRFDQKSNKKKRKQTTARKTKNGTFGTFVDCR